MSPSSHVSCDIQNVATLIHYDSSTCDRQRNVRVTVTTLMGQKRLQMKAAYFIIREMDAVSLCKYLEKDLGYLIQFYRYFELRTSNGTLLQRYTHEIPKFIGCCPCNNMTSFYCFICFLHEAFSKLTNGFYSNLLLTFHILCCEDNLILVRFNTVQ